MLLNWFLLVQVNEVLQSGADLNVTNLKGKRPIELATKPEVIALLKV